jgi:NADH-quinone oxidoreductase subunit L
VLAVCSVFAGFLGVPHSLGGSNKFGKFLEPVFARGEAVQLSEPAEQGGSRSTEYGLMFLSVAAAVVGYGLARRYYARAEKGYTEPIATAAPPLYDVLYQKYYVDEGYDYIFTGRRKVGDVRLGAMGLGEASSWFDAHVIDGTVNGAGWITRLTATLSTWWDKWIIDGLCVNGPAVISRDVLSRMVRLLQWGLVQWYALVMVVGLVGFIAYYAWR